MFLQAPCCRPLDKANGGSSCHLRRQVYSTHLPGVHFEGWTGELSQIVVFHFLDGGGVVDPTRPAASDASGFAARRAQGSRREGTHFESVMQSQHARIVFLAPRGFARCETKQMVAVHMLVLSRILFRRLLQPFLCCLT